MLHTKYLYSFQFLAQFLHCSKSLFATTLVFKQIFFVVVVLLRVLFLQISITIFSSNFLVYSISFYWTLCEFDFMSHSLIWHRICLMNKQWFVRHSLRFITDYQNDGWLFVLTAPSGGPETPGQEVQGWRAVAHADSILWGESVPSRSGSAAGWQRTIQHPPLPVAPGARLELFYLCLLFCLLSSLVLFSVSNRALQTPQPPEGAIQKSAYFLQWMWATWIFHRMLWFPCVALSYPPFILLSVFCFLPVGLHTQIICWAMSRLSPSHWKASHLAVIVFELQKETPIPPFPDRDAMRGKENVFFVREFPWLLGEWCHHTHSSPPSQCFHKLTDQICSHMAEQTTAIYHQPRHSSEHYHPNRYSSLVLHFVFNHSEMHTFKRRAAVHSDSSRKSSIIVVL